MSHHLDKEEFWEMLETGAWKTLWSAYQYAVNGGESSTVEFQKDLLDATKRSAAEEIKLLHDELETLRDENEEYKRANESLRDARERIAEHLRSKKLELEIAESVVRFLAKTLHCDPEFQSILDAINSLTDTRDKIAKRIDDYELKLKIMKDLQLAKEKTVEILKEEISRAEDKTKEQRDKIYAHAHLASDTIEFLLDRTDGWGSTGIYAEQADEDELHDGLKNIREQLGKIKEILADN